MCHVWCSVTHRGNLHFCEFLSTGTRKENILNHGHVFTESISVLKTSFLVHNNARDCHQRKKLYVVYVTPGIKLLLKRVTELKAMNDKIFLNLNVKEYIATFEMRILIGRNCILYGHLV